MTLIRKTQIQDAEKSVTQAEGTNTTDNATTQYVERAVKAQITIVTSVSITNNTTASGYRQHNKSVVISNGANAINITLDTSSPTDFVATYLKHGTGAITFVAGAGATLVIPDSTAILSGVPGSTASVQRVGNTFYVRISNA